MRISGIFFTSDSSRSKRMFLEIPLIMIVNANDRTLQKCPTIVLTCDGPQNLSLSLYEISFLQNLLS